MGGRSRPVFDYDKKRRAEMKALSAIPSYGILGTYTTPVAGTPTQYIARPTPVARPIIDDPMDLSDDEPDETPTRGSKRKAVSEYREGMAKRQRKAEQRSNKRKASNQGGNNTKRKYKPPAKQASKSAKRKATDEYREDMAKRQKKALDRSDARRNDGSRWSSSTRWDGRGTKRRIKQQQGSNKRADTRIPYFYN